MPVPAQEEGISNSSSFRIPEWEAHESASGSRKRQRRLLDYRRGFTDLLKASQRITVAVTFDPPRSFVCRWMDEIYCYSTTLQCTTNSENRHSKSATVNNVSLLFIQTQFTVVLLPLLQQVRQAGPCVE